MHTWIIHVQVAVELCKVVSPQAISSSLPDADNGMIPRHQVGKYQKGESLLILHNLLTQHTSSVVKRTERGICNGEKTKGAPNHDAIVLLCSSFASSYQTIPSMHNIEWLNVQQIVSFKVSMAAHIVL